MLPEPEHGGAVGDDRHGVIETGEIVRRVRIFLDRKTYAGNTRRVDVPEHLQCVDRNARYGPDLAAAMPVENAIRFTDETGRGQLADPVVEAAVRLLVHLERDFPRGSALIATQRGQVLNGEPRVSNHLEHFRETSRLMNSFDDENLGNLHARRVLCEERGRKNTTENILRAVVNHGSRNRYLSEPGNILSSIATSLTPDCAPHVSHALRSRRTQTAFAS